MTITATPLESKPVEGHRATYSAVLPTPAQCRAQHALSKSDAAAVADHRNTISAILRAQDKRLLVIVGPCSIHSVEQALHYADQLAAARPRFDDALFMAMRVYIEKPRTTVGWRGLALDPALDASCGPEHGLPESRRVMKGVIQRGLPVATESLDPIIAPYVSDLLAFSSLGARTSESQTHRQMAAGMPCPVGIKNATSGNLNVAADAIKAVEASQAVLQVGPDGQARCEWVYGNQNAALVLRGGASGANYSAEHQAQARQLLQQRALNAGIIVDCSHGNSNKVAKNQKLVLNCIGNQLRNGQPSPAGVMIESHLHGGKQAFGPLPSLQYGVSVTDECLGMDDTMQCLESLADAVRERNRNGVSPLKTV